MTRIHDVIKRYRSSEAVLEHGVDVFAVGDPAGAELNAAIRRAIYLVGDDGSIVWESILRAANAVRWRRMMQPQPNVHGAAMRDAINAVLRETKRVRGLIGNEALLDRLEAAVTSVSAQDSPVGAELLRSIDEVGASSCVVVANTGAAGAGLRSWLDEYGVAVVTPSELGGLPAEVDQAYLVGAPTFFPASLVTAPPVEAITFVMPAWFGNRSVPASKFASAEGGMAVRAKVHQIGDVAEPLPEVPAEAEVEDVYYPQPDWGRRQADDRDPESDEVEAWKILLGGGLALWLDDGDRIRSLDPRQPAGSRVEYESVDAVQPGAYLVLREGATERGAMYEAALQALGANAASAIKATQEQWKQVLAYRLEKDGPRHVMAELAGRGVRAASRVRGWVEPTLISPKRDEDLAALVSWLGLPVRVYDNARRLRRSLYQASADLRQELEEAVDRADLRGLERDGFMRLDLKREGFRGMIVARVLARSPFTEIVHRQQARVPFSDGSAQWLE
jgi:hypothetical protein